MRNAKRYRVTYGNGQCSPTLTYEAAAAELRSFRGDAWALEYRIQKLDGETGEWVGIGAAGRLATSERSGIEA